MLSFLFGIGLTLFVISRVRRGPMGSRGGSRGRRTRRREWVLNRLSARLHTTPSQDRVLEEVVDDLMDVFSEQRGEFFSTRSGFADILAANEFDAGALADLNARQTDAFGSVQSAVTAALKKAHTVLDHEQRSRLAEFVARRDRSPRRWHHRHHLYAA